ncbi:hypothetical protein XA68_17754 [Ophiocordyceps unilateralis]|uniref:SAM-dependent methyltransferase Erg6/SMT-type domain-containing protein n=1 Tax=Ophiocordyceps unilateralis TaxID=268505 RepID=A0A2A9PRR0_OPHUN|nr:hypothetical protein XA68_17754 [Ophiocordyceps unilateralis]
MFGKNAAAHKAVCDKYFDHWDDCSQDDLKSAREARRESYIDVTASYYNLVTDMFEHFFFGKSFHFYRILRGQPLSEASKLHEQYLASKLNLKPGQKVLDVGCGVGGPAQQIARYSGVKITGINYNDYQIQRGTRYIAKAGLQDQISFVKGNFMQMEAQFEPASFDAAYSIEATSYAPCLKDVYLEIFKALKPGGILAVYELIMTDDYKDENPDHRRLRHDLERGIGIPALAKISEAVDALKEAGFELKEAEDLARRPNEVPWYYPFRSSPTYLNTIWDGPRILWMAFLQSRVVKVVCGLGETLRLFPPGTQKVVTNLTSVGEHLVRAGERNLFTPIFILVGQKPLS